MLNIEYVGERCPERTMFYPLFTSPSVHFFAQPSLVITKSMTEAKTRTQVQLGGQALVALATKSIFIAHGCEKVKH